MTAVTVAAQVADRSADLHFSAEPGSITAVVGPNGAGKSTLLQLVSGQLRPSAGEVRLGDTLVAGPGVHVPTHRRRVAVLEQRALLFDHLDVLDNVAFGPRARGVRPAAARRRARAELDAVGCGDLAARRAWEVSGGQAQRIALARALATDPQVVLLDEPLAALDASVAAAMRSLLRERLRAEHRTTLLVTHDALDALALADALALVEDGRVVDAGPVVDRLTRPRGSFVADLVDVNLLPGRLCAPDRLDLPGGDHVTGLASGPGPHPGPHPSPGPGSQLGNAPDAAQAPGATGFACFAPAAVAVHADPPGGSPRNHWAATVATVEPRGALVRLRCVLADGSPVAADLTLAAAAEGGLAPGRRVWLVVKAAQVTLYAR
ncbi:ABC transporter ATP-binding protein [Propioniciclava soli]|uniref:TOBE-like domain-containing protein n=1 Tax=Propioniciclava soli TaxID=2775081 RepID=UPI001E592883